MKNCKIKTEPKRNGTIRKDAKVGVDGVPSAVLCQHFSCVPKASKDTSRVAPKANQCRIPNQKQQLKLKQSLPDAQASPYSGPLFMVRANI